MFVTFDGVRVNPAAVTRFHYEGKAGGVIIQLIAGDDVVIPQGEQTKEELLDEVETILRNNLTFS